ncbi:MAG: MgtC/SapB family protein [Chloroflexota bacterium]|nr:MgtC/SapB family protein [Chloroflexota bacterium]
MTEWEGLIRVSLALLAGALIGFEREWKKKPAGLRTYALVCQGCAIFMVLGILLSQEVSSSGSVDASRIASTVVQGIGFLAGGVIFTVGARVQGLTTAAAVWVTAAIGLVIGGGFYIIGFGSVLLALVVLRTLVPVEERIIGSEN